MTIPNIVVIDYNMGNVASVAKALNKLGFKNKLSSKKSDIEKATHLILPGVGAFGDGIKNLTELGLVNLLTKRVAEQGTPFLGICLGMQLLAERGHEFGVHEGLGWIKGEVIKLKSPKLPHTGWNNIKIIKKSILDNIPDDNFYFVHSYVLKPKNKSIIAATCKYGVEFPAVIQYKNIFATQFHPEKSQLSGLAVINNFIKYNA
ncbi:MAG: imidazole glycerol phosphate synthase subunit HisH [bacterium]|nr:imidazole glycerol phosphate synthase subunit HisH [bacterium]